MNADGTFESEVDPVITGGSFNFDPTAYVASGYVVAEDGGIYTVSAQA